VVDDDEVPPADVADDSAFELAAKVAYPRGWADAADAVRKLGEALQHCGIADQVPALSADVTPRGAGRVILGKVSPATARLIAALLASAHPTPGPDAGESARRVPRPRRPAPREG